MAGRFHDCVWLITGTTGIAAITAELAVREGARVWIAGLAEADGAQLAGRLRDGGGACGFFAADLTQPAAAQAAVTACVERFGRLDGLFNVVGISGRRQGDGPVHECTDAGWNVTLETNLSSLFYMCRAALRQMLGQAPRPAGGGRGAIVNMSSVLATSPCAPHFATHAYAASKAAILGLTRSMAAYYAPHHIRVNALAPALVRTPMSRRAQADPQILALLKTKQPLAGDLIDPEHVARAALFLLSNDAAMVTGDVLTVDAGWSVSDGQDPPATGPSPQPAPASLPPLP